MAFQKRSRTAKQIASISRLLGVGTSQGQSGVASLLDTGVQEVKRTDQNIKYFVVDGASPYDLPLQDLIAGVNIVGVRTAGPMTIRLPLRAKEEQAITVVDERGTADVDIITVEIA